MFLIVIIKTCSGTFLYYLFDTLLFDFPPSMHYRMKNCVLIRRLQKSQLSQTEDYIRDKELVDFYNLDMII